MYTLKSIARRSTALGMAVAVVAAAVMPAAAVFADALNPLTERSLLLSSSAPGYIDTDGSGNATYAPAGSGPNGMKTGETFTFTVSSSATVEGFSLQYCTAAAGWCQAPGNNTGDADPNNDGSTADSTRETNALAHQSEQRSDFDFVQDGTTAWGEGSAAGQYQIRVDDGTGFTALTGWSLTLANLEDTEHSQPLTGKNNYITLTNGTGEALSAGDIVEIRFRPSEINYITNPGADEFFVKINTYNDSANMIGNHNDTTPADDSDHTVIDGGVTVANVMTDSIHIVTKVLETMAFSVGIENPDTVDRSGTVEHGRCEPISQSSVITGLGDNRLNLGNPDAEYSLETGKAWDTHSYWRLSSNSSGGATVYYSGATLSNTSGDQIADMPTEQLSNPGTEQFGLGFVDAGLDTLANAQPQFLDAPTNSVLNPAYVDGGDTFQSGHQLRSFPFITLSTQTGAPYSGLAAQAASTGYDEATGRINIDGVDPIQAKFQFHDSSNEVPELIAQQNETVISCATAKMRYVANIGADTPAGVYTTKINYLAAPQY